MGEPEPPLHERERLKRFEWQIPNYKNRTAPDTLFCKNSYTLLVHTDRPGGLLMNRKRICEAGEHRITCPDRFGRIEASLVGLDSRLELDGNDDTRATVRQSPSRSHLQQERAVTRLVQFCWAKEVQSPSLRRRRRRRRSSEKSRTGRQPLPTKRDECIDLCEEEGDSAPTTVVTRVPALCFRLPLPPLELHRLPTIPISSSSSSRAASLRVNAVRMPWLHRALRNETDELEEPEGISL